MSKKSDFFHYVKLFAPILISQYAPHGDLLAPIVAHGIQAAQDAHDERIAAGGDGLSGPEKLALARTEIAVGASALQAVYPAKVDPAIVDDAFMEAVSTVVDISKIAAKAKTKSD